MRVVNLSRRPFVNRRPILRLAILLWIVGAVLLVVNVRLYTNHWLGSAENRRLLAEVRQKLALQEKRVAEKSQELQRVSLDRRNRRAAFLNQLIDARTFPWSGLFEDLEKVLPEGVRLISVRPEVRLASNRRSRQQSQRTSSEPGQLAGEELTQDQVDLRLSGIAQSFDQLDEFVRRLYGHPFAGPYLSGTTLTGQGRTMSFNISTVYQTRREPLPPLPPLEIELAYAAEAESEGGPDEEGASATGSSEDGLETPPDDGGQIAEQNPEGLSGEALPGGSTTSGESTASSSIAGTPAAGTPAAGTSIPGAPTAGAPTAGTPATGPGSRSGTQIGTPSQGIAALPNRPPPPLTSERENPRTPPPPDRGSRRPASERPQSSDRPQSPDRPESPERTDPSERPEEPGPSEDDPSFGDRDASSTPGVRQ